MSDQQESHTPTLAEPFSVESWEIARNYSALLGVVPSSFSSVIRSLMSDQKDNSVTLSSGSRFLAERLARSPTVKACLYFSGMTYFPEKFQGVSYASEQFLVDLFSPAELGVSIGLAYLFHRSRKLCVPDQFIGITNRLQNGAELGGFVGQAIPSVSLPIGFITGAMPSLSLSPFLFYDRKGYIDYMRHLRNIGKPFDFGYEMGRWSCTSPQVGSVMLQAMGLGVNMAQSYSVGLTSQSEEVIDADPDAYRFWIAHIWITALSTSQNAPNMVHRAQYYPTEAQLERLKENAFKLKESGSQHCWLLRNGGNVSPEATPILFDKAKKGPKKSKKDGHNTDESLLSSEEINQLDTELKKVLDDD